MTDVRKHLRAAWWSLLATLATWLRLPNAEDLYDDALLRRADCASSLFWPVGVTTAPEAERREAAYANRGQVVPDTGTAVRGRKLDVIQSVRFDHDTAARLREIAEARGIGLSGLLREAALSLGAPRTWSCDHFSMGGSSLVGPPSCAFGCDMRPAAVTA